MSSHPEEPFQVQTPQGTIEILPPESGAPAQFATPPRPNYRRAVILFVLTCLSTWYVGTYQGGWLQGLVYAVPLMGILLCHELGHFVQARRYREPASPPYFIPLPLPPFGTMGAVILMSGRMLHRKSLFDIGISGPLAGLVPALICSYVGLGWSKVIDVSTMAGGRLGEPLLFQWMAHAIFGTLPAGQDIVLHPLAFAGWVGIFITALNLFPIGQLDGGHILYALLRKKAHIVATILLLAAIVASLLTMNLSYAPMLFLLFVFGPIHPPTLDDDAPLGLGRYILGWVTLAFIFIGFTPNPL